MKHTFKKAVLMTTFVATMASTVFAAGFGLEGPGVNYRGYDWLTTSARSAYAVIPAKVTSEVDAARRITIWTAEIKEVPNPWTVRDEILPILQSRGIDTALYKDYHHTISTYHIAVKYDYNTVSEARSHQKTYYVSKVTEQDFDSLGNPISGIRSFPENFAEVRKGSDAYEIAYEIEKGYYNPEVIKTLPAVGNKYEEF